MKLTLCFSLLTTNRFGEFTPCQSTGGRSSTYLRASRTCPLVLDLRVQVRINLNQSKNIQWGGSNGLFPILILLFSSQCIV